ncbi:MFS transporter [Candidatus Poribacteria bacterium]|nr:MFS transporter [Candidatus Poribacteria bacterium]
MNHRFVHYSMAFLMQLFISVGALAAPLLATRLGASSFELGMMGALGAATYAFTVIFAGTLSDKFGRKQVILAGTLFTGFAFGIMPLSRIPLHLIILTGLSGIAMAFYWPVLEAWMSEEGDPEHVRQEMSAFNVSWSTGGFIGPLVGGFLFTFSSTLAFLFAAAGVLPVAYLALSHTRPTSCVSPSPETAATAAENGAAIVKRSFLYVIWIANFASWFAISEIRVLFPKLGLAELGMQPWLIGILIFILSLALAAMFYALSVLKRWHNTVAPLLYSQIVIFVLLLVTAASDSPVVLGLAFAGLGAGFAVPYSYSLYFSVVGSANKGAASGRHEMVLGTGGLLGPLLGGVAAEILRNQRAPYVLGAAFILISLIVQGFVLSSRRGSQA